MFAINGRFVVREFGGQERYSYEVISALDEIAEIGEYELIVPAYAEKIPQLKNIKVVKYGNVRGHLWEQTSFLLYLLKNDYVGVNPCITCPILKPDIVTLHDILQFTGNIQYKTLYGKLSGIWHNTMFRAAARKAKLIFTVSQFSKSEIIKYLHVDPKRIVVTGNGWQHFQRIVEDDGIFERHVELKKGQYYLSASSLTPQKNFKWIVEAAKNNPDCQFAIAGKQVSISQGEVEQVINLHYLGYVTDGEMKALMKNCKAFIHPALYEGFGITPMEALSVGANVILSKAACLPEIYGDCVHYIDPNNANVDLQKILLESVEDSKTVLDKYTWNNMGRIVYQSLKQLQ